MSPRRTDTTVLDPALAAGHQLHVAGRFAEAEDAYRGVLADRPRDAEAWHLLGLTKSAQEDGQAAVRALQKAVELKPGEARYHNNLGHVFRLMGRLSDASRELGKAVELRPIFPGAHYNLGLTLHALGHVRDAEEHFRKACAQDSDYVQAHYWLGLARQDLGQLDGAVEAFERAVTLRADYVPAVYALAQAQTISAEDDPLLLRVQSLAFSEGGSVADRMLIHFALGKLNDDLGDYMVAADQYDQANELYEKKFDARIHAARIEALRSTFNPEFFPAHRHRGSRSNKPVFVVGMPRSGSTLISQIISAHPEAISVGERTDLPELIAQLESEKGGPYARWAGDLGEADLQRLATGYLSRVTRQCPNALRVVDKLPGNWQHLGLIALLFPRARVIVCERDPCAVAWSCYSHKFDRGQSFTYDLEHIAMYYHVYRRAMDYWIRILPLQIKVVSYEKLVEDPEKIIHEIIDFCGLEWDAACMSFHEAESVVTSASNLQVRKGIYSDALEHWRNYSAALERFERKLQDLQEGQS
ncbi:MAG: tetratricopeptide repeat protein [Gammaproteobacteria bacterium]|nr:MAG: tetratricopeptide repeat protein [Gammaproteobacteria bacterium]